jgi:serine/threonine protein kinase
MNLEYLEILNIENNLNGPIKQKLDEIAQENERRRGQGQLFVNIVSKDVNVDNYTKVFNLKKTIIQKNILSMLQNNCRETKNKATFLEKKGAGAFGVVTTTKVNLANDKIEYNANGKFEIVVKALSFDTTGNPTGGDFYKYLSDLAKEVRSGQCLYNIFNYDMDGPKYENIERRLIRRDRYITDVMLEINEPFKILDAIGVMDCQYYTPPQKGRFQLPNVNISENTQFYLAMPKMDGNIEEFFFDKEKNHHVLYPGQFHDTVKFRLTLCFKMIQAMKNIHEMGFINKDIKPENYLYKIHPVTDIDYNIVLSIADFGLAGIDDYNTFQYSDLSYRPFDDLTFLSKELDVYQLGVSMFQVIYDIPKPEIDGDFSLRLINTLLNSAQMKFLFDIYVKNGYSGFSVLANYKFTSQQQKCIYYLVDRLYNDLQTYEYPNYKRENNFDFFFMEMFNVKSHLNNGNYEEIFTQDGFKSAIRSYYITNYITIPECTNYYDLHTYFKYIFRTALHPDPNSRGSAKTLVEEMSDLLTRALGSQQLNLEYSQDYRLLI